MAEPQSFRASQGFIMVVIFIAMFVDGFISNVVAPIVPYILEDKELVAYSQIQIGTAIVFACYGVADFVGGPICAWYVDSTSHRRMPFLLGLVGMIAGTILFGFCSSLAMLAVARAMQGLASAVLYTVGMAILVDTVNRDQLGKWMGTALCLNKLGIILSPLIGGILYTTSGQWSVFWCMAALVIIDSVLRVMMIDKKLNVVPIEDSPRQSAVGESQHANLAALMRAQPISRAEMVDMVDVPLSPKTRYEDFVHQNADTIEPDFAPLPEPVQPVPPPRSRQGSGGRGRGKGKPSRIWGVITLITSPRLITALYGSFINESLVSSLCTILPLFASRTFDWDPIDAGMLFLTIAVPSLFSPLAGHLADCFGCRSIAIIGFVITTPLLACLRFIENDTMTQKILLCVMLTGIGFGLTFFLAPLGTDLSNVTTETQERLERTAHERQPLTREGKRNTKPAPTLYASAFSLMNCAMAAAVVVGPLLVGGINQGSGWKWATVCMTAMSFTAAVPVCFFTAGLRKEKITIGLGIDPEERRWYNEKKGT